MATTSRATTIWTGDLPKGRGAVSASSGVLRDEEVTWAARAETREVGTSPEELLAAAHASCFCMALAGALGRAGTPPQRIECTASVTFDKGEAGFQIVSSALEVRAEVAGIDQEAFTKAAEGAKDGCPVSKALKGNVELSVRATLA